MQRIFNDYAYSDGPRQGCWWDETADIPPRPAATESLSVDVAVVGAGFTGLSAALGASENGASTVVLEAQRVGWGASGRNGGFCCLGGSKASDAEIDKRFGKKARLEYRAAEKRAVAWVEALIERLDLDVDRHSNGETVLAHRPKDMLQLHRDARSVAENYGVEAELIERDELRAQGMIGGPFFGGMTIPIGFGLNPRKYIAGLALQIENCGAQIFEKTPVTSMAYEKGRWLLRCSSVNISAHQVVFATNGYSSENLPSWLAARYMPSQSNVLVTRPLKDPEIQSQGWSSPQMSYDTRNLLHYFRLMPDRRFLFGMRGALLTTPVSEAKARATTRRHFEHMFPAWAQVESSHCWSGMVSLARHKMPYVGEAQGQPGVWVAMCYHGNGVAMGSYAGSMVAELLTAGRSDDRPAAMASPLTVFPLGRARRLLMPPLYAALMFNDL